MLKGMSWAEFVCPEGEPIAKGMVCATLVKCYQLLWTFNPCKVVCKDQRKQDKGQGVYSQVAISTLDGHLIQGEEKFQVQLNTIQGNDQVKGTVTLSLLSFTRGSGILGSIAMPFIRPLQTYFFNDIVASFRNIMEEERNNSR
jgi:uncharacterized protein (UPF0548 family)